MALDEFVARQVAAGEPLTAQAWNDIVNALAAMNQHLRTSEGSAVRVQVTNADIDRALVRVTAARQDDGLAFEAVGPIAPSTEHLLTGLRPGSYTLRAEANGFATVTQALTVPTPAVVSLTLSAASAAMPALFGETLRDALAAVAALGVSVTRVLDITGRDVAPANPGAEYLDSPVLLQLPDGGTRVVPGIGVQFVVATSLAVEPSVEMPSIAGLTLVEARRALEALGLVLGRVETRERRT